MEILVTSVGIDADSHIVRITWCQDAPGTSASISINENKEVSTIFPSLSWEARKVDELPGGESLPCDEGNFIVPIKLKELQERLQPLLQRDRENFPHLLYR